MPITTIFSGRTHKESESITDCQDYFQTNPSANCFAIADGSTRSFYASIWSKLLVDWFCQNPEISQGNWQEWLKPIQEEWFLDVKTRVEKAKAELKPTWIQHQNKLNAQESATSTFIGLQLIEESVRVCIVGDSCLFVLHGNQVQPHLLKSSKDFTDRPEYLASYAKDNDYQPNFLNIPLHQNETSEKVHFILATDALSEYIFKCIEHKQPIFQTLLQISSQPKFEDFVSSARSNNTIKMKSDDVALMTLCLDSKNQKSSLGSVEIGIGKSKDIPESETTQDETANLTNEQKTAKKIIHLKRQRAILVALFLLSLGVNAVQLNQQPKSTQTEPIVIKPTQTEPILPKSPQPDATQTKSPQPEPTKSKPKDFEIKEGTPIYKDESTSQLLVEKSLSTVKVLVLEEKEKSIKIQIELYAHPTNSISGDCKSNDLEINENIRTSANFQNDRNLFGKLTGNSKFKNLNTSAKEGEGCKFQFVGYVKK